MKSFPKLTIVLMILLAAASGCGEVPGSGGKKKKSSSRARKRAPVAANAFGSVDQAVSELIEAATDKNLQKQDRAGDWLADRGAKSIEPLAAILKSSDQSEQARVAACRVLAKLGPGARSALLQATDDETQIVRLAATRLLGAIQPADKQTVDRLIQLLGHQDRQTKRAAVRSLGEIGKEAKAAAKAAIEPLVAIYRDESNDQLLRQDAVKALKIINPRKDLTDLLLND
jgi:HEAT repeat protein